MRTLQRAAAVGLAERYERGEDWIEVFRWTSIIKDASSPGLKRGRAVPFMPGYDLGRDPAAEDETDFGKLFHSRRLSDVEIGELKSWSPELGPEVVFSIGCWLILAAVGACCLVTSGLWWGLAYCAVPPVLTVSMIWRNAGDPDLVAELYAIPRTGGGFAWFEMVDNCTWTMEGVPSPRRIDRTRAEQLKRFFLESRKAH